MKTALLIYVVGTVLTLAVAALLWHHRKRLAAATLILVSPFPCPSGLPC